MREKGRRRDKVDYNTPVVARLCVWARRIRMEEKELGMNHATAFTSPSFLLTPISFGAISFSFFFLVGMEDVAQKIVDPPHCKRHRRNLWSCAARFSCKNNFLRKKPWKTDLFRTQFAFDSVVFGGRARKIQAARAKQKLWDRHGGWRGVRSAEEKRGGGKEAGLRRWCSKKWVTFCFAFFSNFHFIFFLFFFIVRIVAATDDITINLLFNNAGFITIGVCMRGREQGRKKRGRQNEKSRKDVLKERRRERETGAVEKRKNTGSEGVRARNVNPTS